MAEGRRIVVLGGRSSSHITDDDDTTGFEDARSAASEEEWERVSEQGPLDIEISETKGVETRIHKADELCLIEEKANLESSSEQAEFGESEEGGKEEQQDQEIEDQHVFSMGDEPLEENKKKVYRRISNMSTGHSHVNKLTFVKRVSLHKDRKYTVGFLITCVIAMILGLGSSRVEQKHHYLLSLTVSLALSGGLTAIIVGAHYRLFKLSIPTAFSIENLRFVQPLEVFVLSCVSLAIWTHEWSGLAALVPVSIAIFDGSRISNAAESLQFATVVLDMASEIVTLDNQLAPVIRRTWILFVLQNGWLIVWTWFFVDAASGSDHVSLVTVAVLFFALFWTTQVLRSLLSFYVTGAVVYRLVFLQDMHQEGADGVPQEGEEDSSNRKATQDLDTVQELLFKRGLSTCFGSVCAGGLLIGPLSLFWGILELFRASLAKCFGKDKSSSVTQDADELIDEQESASRRRRKRSSSSIASNSVKQLQTKFAVSIMSGANRYGWARVALRGTRFVKSSHEAWELLQMQGVHGVINADLAETIIRSWSWIFGSVTALLSLVVLPSSTSQTSEILFLFFMASFALGASNASLLLEPLRATVGSIYVSFAEDSNCFAKDHPIVHHRMSRLCELSRFAASVTSSGDASPMDPV